MSKRLALILNFFFAFPLLAHLHPGPCEWVIDGQFLYLKASIDDTYFVLQGASPVFTNPQGTWINNDFSFHPGFRVGGSFGLGEEREIQLYYTRLDVKKNKIVSGSELWASVGDTGFNEIFGNYTGNARSHLKCLYQNFDLLFAQQILTCSPLRLYVEAGIEAANLRLRENYNFDDLENEVFGSARRSNQTWGVGPEFGFEGEFGLCTFSCCRAGILSLTGLFRTSLLASKTSRETFSNTTDISGFNRTRIDVREKLTWRVIPVLHGRLGIKYAICYEAFSPALEIGYECSSYIRGLSRVVPRANIFSASMLKNWLNFDLHGLYLTLEAGF